MKDKLIKELQEKIKKIEKENKLLNSKLNQLNIYKDVIFLNSIFNEISPIILLINPTNGEIINANKSAQEFYGFTLSELKKLTIFDIDKTDTELQKKLLLKSDKNSHNSFITKHKLKNGETKDVRIQISPFTFGNEKLLFGVVTDITEMKSYEDKIKLQNKKLRKLLKELSASTQRYKILFDYAPIGIYVANLKGEILDINPKALEILGSPSAEVTKKINLFEFLPLQKIGYTDKLKDVITKKEVIEFNTYYTSKWGRTVYLKNLIVPLTNKKKEIELIYTVMMDETKEYEYRMKLLNQNEEMKILNNNKDIMLSIIGHDLKNPISGIAGLSEILVKNLNIYDKNTIKDFLLKINQSSLNALELLDKLIEWSIYYREKKKINLEKTEIKKIIEHILSLNKQNALKKSISLSTNINKNVYVIGDSNYLRTILLNLVSNSIKFTKENGKIEILCKETGKNKIEIAVKDTGIGISKEKIDKILNDNFIRSTQGTNNEIGTGLGISLVKDMLKKLNSKLQIESEPGKGSKFYFLLDKAE